MYLKLSKFLIIGISKSGFSAGNALLTLGADCTLYDNSANATTSEMIEKLRMRGAHVASKDNIEDEVKKCDIVVLSPGVAIDNDIPVMARRFHKKVIGELELGSSLIKNPIVAVTGTNGKTTTCYLLEHVLSLAGVKNFLAGNMGQPICDKIFSDSDSLAVVEVSSYQLETISSFTPHIACILNISPDHLTRHYNMENYIYLKGRILKNMRESEYAVLNADDKTVSGFAENTRAHVLFFSMSSKVDGAYLFENKIYFRDEFIIEAQDVAIKGGHNIQNALAVVCISKLLGIENEVIKNALITFSGVKHRQQVVARKGGITFVNDSKSTNPASSVSALNECPENSILIIGGRDKGEGYENLFEKIHKSGKIKSVIIYGESCSKLYNLALISEIDDISVVKNFERAVNLSFLIAKRGDTILLSPACASFDEFSGFEERGEKFISMVEKFAPDDEE